MKHITHWTVAALALLGVGVGSAMAAEEIQDCENCPVMVVIPGGARGDSHYIV
jgi:hypothetical protein